MSYSEISNKPVKVRKAHRCAWCAERIEVGESAQYRAYKSDGDFGSDYMHPECNAAGLKVPSDELADGWSPGDYKRGSHEASN